MQLGPITSDSILVQKSQACYACYLRLQAILIAIKGAETLAYLRAPLTRL